MAIDPKLEPEVIRLWHPDMDWYEPSPMEIALILCEYELAREAAR